MNDSDEMNQLDVNMRNIRAALSGEEARVRFIRLAATLNHEHGAWEAHESWRRAKLLWDAKPEDC